MVALAGVLLLWRALPASLPARQRESASAAPGRAVKRLWLALYAGRFTFTRDVLSQMAHSLFAQGQLAALSGRCLTLRSGWRGADHAVFSAPEYAPQAWVMILQGLGVASGVLIPGVSGLLISTVMVGLGFLFYYAAVDAAGARRLQYQRGKTVAILTSGYATGQLIGPLISAASVLILLHCTPRCCWPLAD